MPGPDTLQCLPDDYGLEARYGICLASDQTSYALGENTYTLSFPKCTAREAKSFLEQLSSPQVLVGDSTGTGIRLSQLGENIPKIRQEYEKLINDFIKELDDKVKNHDRLGLSKKEVAQWAVKRRREIAQSMRSKQGLGSTILLEVRDTKEYGWGGRTYDNLAQRAIKKGTPRADVNRYLIESAMRPNTGISKGAILGARYLKHGGRIVLIISVAASAYTILTTPEEEMGKVLFKEAGGLLGGIGGAGVGTGICLVFGIVTTGWGLLACGLIGGMSGGVLGSIGGEQIYFATHPINFEKRSEDDFLIIDRSELSPKLPANMCY